jgi:small subunit ribosomal protein S6
MEGYESIFILDPNVSDEDQQGALARYKETVEGQGGQVLHQTTWGRRRLAYPVKKRDYGIYHLLYLDRSPDAMKALENIYRFDENVIKWFTVAVEDVDAELEKFERLKTQGSVYILKQE